MKKPFIVMAIFTVGIIGFQIYTQVAQNMEDVRVRGLLMRARVDEGFRDQQLSRIPLNRKYGIPEMSNMLMLATGEPYTPELLHKSFRLTMEVNGHTFVFEADSTVAAALGRSNAWERLK